MTSHDAEKKKDSEKAITTESYSEDASIHSKRPSEKNKLDDKRGPALDSNIDTTFLVSERRAVEERRLVRKLDMRLLPTIVLIYVMNYIDRTNVTTARLKGIEQDLGLSDIQYDAVVAILYASYCPAQIPSNMILNYVTRPSWYIGGCVVLWGLASALTGITQSFGGIMATRLCIGIPEAAFYPGTMYLLSRWYTKKELAFRSAILYGGLLMSNAFGSLLAAGILSGMEGKRGVRGWRWLFFIEGAVTILVGFLSMWALPDYPVNTRWLSPSERHLAQARLAEDTGEADQDQEGESMWMGLKLACKDIKVPIFSLMAMVQILGLSYVNFFPTLTATLGFNTTITLLLAAPPWIYATIACCLNALHADKTGERFFHLAVPWWGVIIGYIIGVSTFSVGGRYVALFLMASGYAGFALTLVWVSNAIPRPPTKRAAAMGLVNGFGNIGNLVGSFAWKAQWGPAYHQSMFIGIGALSASTLLGYVMRCILIRDNKKLDRDELGDLKGADRERIEEFARLEGITFEEALERKRGFRYLY